MSTYPSRASVEKLRDDAMTALTAITENPKPSYSADGQSFSWGEYARMLQERIDWATEMLKKIDGESGDPGYEETVIV